MCEHFVARAAEPFRLDELWPFTERLERFGIAGFGWGAAWLARRRPARVLPRRPGLPRRPRARARSAPTRRRSLLVHLRRPSKLSTLQLPDTQPFDDPAGRFAFSHNGDLRDYRALARRTGPQGRIHGRADTEVGAALARGRLATTPEPPADAARRAPRGSAARPTSPSSTATARRTTTPATARTPSSRSGSAGSGSSSTGIYSLDRSLFRSPRPGATDRRLVRPGVDRRARPRRDDRRGRCRRPRRSAPGPRVVRLTAGTFRGSGGSHVTAAAGDAGDATGPSGGRPTRCCRSAARPDLALLARPDRDRRGGRRSSSRPPRVRRPRGPGRRRARPSFLIAIGGAIIAIVVQPTVGSISDYTISRWGRRKPYIVVGSLLDVVFLVGIATSNTLARDRRVRRAAAVQHELRPGAVPGLRPGPRRRAARSALASALVGLMQVLGNVPGFVIGVARGRARTTSGSRSSRSASSSSSRC